MSVIFNRKILIILFLVVLLVCIISIVFRFKSESSCEDCNLYTNHAEKISFYYPKNWVVEDLKPHDSLEPFVKLSDQDNSVIFLGGPSVFSTSGSICIDSERICGEPTQYDLSIMDQPYQLNLFGLYPLDQTLNPNMPLKNADFYRFQLDTNIKTGHDQNPLIITGQIPDAIYLESALPIISSIQTR